MEASYNYFSLKILDNKKDQSSKGQESKLLVFLISKLDGSFFNSCLVFLQFQYMITDLCLMSNFYISFDKPKYSWLHFLKLLWETKTAPVMIDLLETQLCPHTSLIRNKETVLHSRINQNVTSCLQQFREVFTMPCWVVMLQSIIQQIRMVPTCGKHIY